MRQVLKNDVKTIFLDVLNSELPESKQVVQRLIQRTGCRYRDWSFNGNFCLPWNAFASGASDYLVNPVTPHKILNTSPLLLCNSTTKNEMKNVSIVSAKGGSGSSTIIATLSQQLAEIGKRVTCMDLDFSMGDLDLLLNVEGNTALVELLQYPERLEPLAFERRDQCVSRALPPTGYLPLDTTPFWPQKAYLISFYKFRLQTFRLLTDRHPDLFIA
ncbi:P-loop NTPase [Vibrio lentus]|nr:P-loop NTPase [Vibrio lentus]